MIPLNSNELMGISIEIERIRAQMVQLVEEYGFMHPIVQQCSGQLDLLLLSYYQLDKQLKLKGLEEYSY